VEVQDLSLKELLANGHIAMIELNSIDRKAKAKVDGWLRTWFVHEKHVLKRRQELPPDAFGNLEKLKEWSLSAQEFTDVADKNLAYVISHGWLAPRHPDPLGKRRPDISAMGRTAFVFWDYLSLHQVDRCGLRTAHEEVCFRTALRGMDQIYTNPKWEVFRFVTVAEDAENGMPYMRRGWCVFESSSASVGAKSLQTIRDGVLVQNEPKMLPMTPSRFRDLVKTLHFTSKKADSQLVAELFEKVFPRLAAHERLSFVAWEDSQVLELIQILPELTGLKVVRIQNLLSGCRAKVSEDAMKQLNDLLASRGGELRVGQWNDSNQRIFWVNGNILDDTKENIAYFDQ